MEKLTLDNLGVQFVNIAAFESEASVGFQADDSALQFGPSKAFTRSYTNWEGCDGKTYYPYNKSENIGKLSDFISAASA